jgi:two-component system cell cycle response regulator DivK
MLLALSLVPHRAGTVKPLGKSGIRCQARTAPLGVAGCNVELAQGGSDEDNGLNAKLCCDLLNAHGYRVLHAKHGAVAFEMARRVKPDLIVMHIQLPGASAVEVTRWLKQDSSLRWIPVFAVIGYAMRGNKETILEGGCDAYMSIPISVAEFLETIKALSGTRSAAAAGC